MIICIRREYNLNNTLCLVIYRWEAMMNYFGLELPVLAWVFLIILAVQVFFFVLAIIGRTDRYTDLAYGSTFVLVAWVLSIGTASWQLLQIALTLAITLWGVRLAGYLFYRILTIKKDDRFDQIRNNVLKFGMFWLLQAVSIWIIMLPSSMALTSTGLVTWSLWGCAGSTVFILGWLIETAADQQKFGFKQKAENKGKWIESGLWRYSRHPNYFGEILVWTGVFLMAMPYLSGWSWLTAIGPFWITGLLLFGTGIPTTEKSAEQRYGADPAYQDYKKRTSILVPWPPKGIS